jgi:hypothetical protein
MSPHSKTSANEHFELSVEIRVTCHARLLSLPAVAGEGFRSSQAKADPRFKSQPAFLIQPRMPRMAADIMNRRKQSKRF